MTTVLRYDNLPAVPWRNGLGITREVVSAPTDAAFDWRVSIAEVVAAGPFSTFEGVDRTLMVIDGDALHLDVDGVDHRLHVGDALAFSGEDAVVGKPSGATVLALNLMTRRGRASGSVEVIDVAPGRTLEATLVCALGDLLLGDGVRLGRFDCALLDGPITAASAGQVARIDVTAASQVGH